MPGNRMSVVFSGQDLISQALPDLRYSKDPDTRVNIPTLGQKPKAAELSETAKFSEWTRWMSELDALVGSDNLTKAVAAIPHYKGEKKLKKFLTGLSLVPNLDSLRSRSPPAYVPNIAELEDTVAGNIFFEHLLCAEEKGVEGRFNQVGPHVLNAISDSMSKPLPVQFADFKAGSKIKSADKDDIPDFVVIEKGSNVIKVVGEIKVGFPKHDMQEPGVDPENWGVNSEDSESSTSSADERHEDCHHQD